MSADFMPLSGAILVSNPRRSEPVGIALENPNDHKRINAGARAVAKGKLTADDVIAMIKAGKSRKEIQMAAGTYVGAGTKLGQPAKPAKGRAYNKGRAAAMKKVADGLAGPTDRKALDAARRQIISGLSEDDRWGRGYSGRFFKSAAGRYISKSKKISSATSKHGKQFQGFLKGGGHGTVSHVTVNVDGILAANKTRQARRVASGKQRPDWRQTGDDMFRGGVLSKAWHDMTPAERAAHRSKVKAGQKTQRRARSTASTQTKSQGTKKPASAGYREYDDLVQQLKAGGMSHKAAQAQAKRMRDAGYEAGVGILANDNPGMFGGIALTNPLLSGDIMADLKQVAIMGGIAVAGGGVHAVAVPWISENIYAKSPVGAEFLQDYDYAITGAVSAVVLAVASRYVSGNARMALTALSAGVAAAGGLLQAQKSGLLDFGFAGDEDDLDVSAAEGQAALNGIALDNEGMFGGLAVDNAGMFHGIALENEGMFGGIALDNYGDGMAYELGDLSGPFDDAAAAYASASYADAMHAAADFDVAEGQAAVEGAGSWMNRFGHPPVRLSPMGGARGAASHLAGRHGHRWGWLVKLVGFKKFQQIAQLPPEQRVRLINSLRQQAMGMVQRELTAGVPPQPEAVSGSTASAPQGVDSSYGAMLFSGATAL